MRVRFSRCLVSLLLVSIAAPAFGIEAQTQPYPAVTSLPWLDQVLGEEPIRLGESLEDLDARLGALGTKKVKGEDVTYVVKPSGMLVFNIWDVTLYFYSGQLKQVKVIYHLNTRGLIPIAQFEAKIEDLLGKSDGYTKGREGPAKAWQKGTALIALDTVPKLNWWILEMYDPGE